MKTATCSAPIVQTLAAQSTVFSTARSPKQMNLHLHQVSAKLPKGVHVFIFLDNTIWHTSTKLKDPDNVWLLNMPPYSPQLNSAENLFQYSNDNFIANRVFEITNILKEAVRDGLNEFAKSKDRIKSTGKRSWATLTNQNETSDENKTCHDGLTHT